jgi:hypothetical protein
MRLLAFVHDQHSGVGRLTEDGSGVVPFEVGAEAEQGTLAILRQSPEVSHWSRETLLPPERLLESGLDTIRRSIPPMGIEFVSRLKGSLC